MLLRAAMNFSGGSPGMVPTTHLLLLPRIVLCSNASLEGIQVWQGASWIKNVQTRELAFIVLLNRLLNVALGSRLRRWSIRQNASLRDNGLHEDFDDISKLFDGFTVRP